MKNLHAYQIGAALLAVAILGGCADQEKAVPETVWSAEDLAKPVAVEFIDKTWFESRHRARLAPGAAETPHTHEDHDLVVEVVSGSARVHTAGAVILAKPGTKIEIPSGTVHWAENLSKTEPAEAIVIFSPPFDGKDTVPAK
jgi:quercetin dioxygenase-like cupin family protein